MKLCKKALIAAAVTGVLPNQGQSAALNQNLVLNPSFEDGAGTAASIWNGSVSTYAYALNYTGPAPAGAGSRYWFGGGGDPLANQVIDLTGNALAIDGGLLRYNFSAFFSTYLQQHDFGTARALFMNGANGQIGSAAIGGSAFVGGLPVGDNGTYPDARSWGQDALSGLVPNGTRTVVIELDGDKDPTVGTVCDSYIDLVNFQLTAVPEPGTVSLFALGLLGGWMYIRRRR